MIARRVIVWSYSLLFVVVATLSGMFFFRTYEEYARLRQLEAESRLRLAQAQAKLEAQKVVLERMRSDPAYVDRVIRARLLYGRPDELLFRFDADNRAPDQAPAPRPKD